MGYYANGSGSITFSRELTDYEVKKIESILEDAWFEFDFFMSANSRKSSNPHNPVGLDLWQDEKYHGDDVEKALRSVSETTPITEGYLAYIGEDGVHWRFLYKPEDNSWHEQAGHVVYTED